jgi:PPOX class probable F420-dependent enzyme
VSRTMTRDEWRAFVSEGPRTAVLATVRRDGRAHVAPVWFVLDGDDVVLTTGEDTMKGRALRRDPRVSLCVDDATPPFSFVTIDGHADISRDPDQLLEWATAIAARYMGSDRAEEFGRRNAVSSELLVRIHVERVVALADISD